MNIKLTGNNGAEKSAPVMIDLTPTWRGIMPALIAAITDGTPTGRSIAIEELMRLADMVDAANERAKAEESAE